MLLHHRIAIRRVGSVSPYTQLQRSAKVQILARAVTQFPTPTDAHIKLGHSQSAVCRAFAYRRVQ